MKVIHFFSIHPYFRKIIKRRFGETSKSDYIQNIKQAHNGFLPNYLLGDLFKSGKLALQVIPVEMSQDIKSDFMNQYLRAEVWIFSFMDYSVDFEAISTFFKDCRRLAKEYNIKIINGTCAPRYQNKISTVGQFPLIAKPKQNGVPQKSIAQNSTFSVLWDKKQLMAWENSIADSRPLFVLEPYYANTSTDQGLYIQERWIVIFDDLTVGIRISRDNIIKRKNSMTYFLRNRASLRMDLSVLDDIYPAPDTLEHAYCDDLDLWELRYKRLAKFLNERPNMEIFSLDVIFHNKDFFIVDSNEHTFEEGTKSLRALWTNILYTKLQEHTVNNNTKR